MTEKSQRLSFWCYHLTTCAGNNAESRRGAICLGERVKKGTYRATIATIPYSQIAGALRAALPIEKERLAQIHAAGKFTNLGGLEDRRATIGMSVRQRVSGAAQIPIDTTVLVDVEGEVYVEINAVTQDWERTHPIISIKMGAYRSKGLGRCRLEWRRRIDFESDAAETGFLATRIPQEHLARFGITTVTKPVYGYLFQPDLSYTTGKYVLSLFERSIVKGPRFLLED